MRLFQNMHYLVQPLLQDVVKLLQEKFVFGFEKSKFEPASVKPVMLLQKLSRVSKMSKKLKFRPKPDFFRAKLRFSNFQICA